MSEPITHRIWVELETHDPVTDKYESDSMALDGASVATFENIDEAIAFGNTLQRIGTILFEWVEAKREET